MELRSYSAQGGDATDFANPVEPVPLQGILSQGMCVLFAASQEHTVLYQSTALIKFNRAIYFK